MKDLSNFEKIDTKLKIEKETEKAIAVRVSGYVGFSSCGYATNNFKWIPKSVALIENNELVALKGWFIDKECAEHYELVSKESVDRFEERYCKKAN